jgi:hypothetical protein
VLIFLNAHILLIIKFLSRTFTRFNYILKVFLQLVAAFNPEKAYINRLNSKVRYTDIVVQISNNARAIDELAKSTASDDRYELF